KGLDPFVADALVLVGPLRRKIARVQPFRVPALDARVADRAEARGIVEAADGQVHRRMIVRLIGERGAAGRAEAAPRERRRAIA
nr:hypothetical protein [Tanacetum cinerariifolium]